MAKPKILWAVQLRIASTTERPWAVRAFVKVSPTGRYLARTTIKHAKHDFNRTLTTGGYIVPWPVEYDREELNTRLMEGLRDTIQIVNREYEEPNA